jgi:hypothetical protein
MSRSHAGQSPPKQRSSVWTPAQHPKLQRLPLEAIQLDPSCSKSPAHAFASKTSGAIGLSQSDLRA